MGKFDRVTPDISPGLISKVELTRRLNLRNLATKSVEVAIRQRKGGHNSNL